MKLCIINRAFLFFTYAGALVACQGDFETTRGFDGESAQQAGKNDRVWDAGLNPAVNQLLLVPLGPDAEGTMAAKRESPQFSQLLVNTLDNLGLLEHPERYQLVAQVNLGTCGTRTELATWLSKGNITIVADAQTVANHLHGLTARAGSSLPEGSSVTVVDGRPRVNAAFLKQALPAALPPGSKALLTQDEAKGLVEDLGGGKASIAGRRGYAAPVLLNPDASASLLGDVGGSKKVNLTRFFQFFSNEKAHRTNNAFTERELPFAQRFFALNTSSGYELGNQKGQNGLMVTSYKPSSLAKKLSAADVIRLAFARTNYGARAGTYDEMERALSEATAGLKPAKPANDGFCGEVSLVARRDAPVRIVYNVDSARGDLSSTVAARFAPALAAAVAGLVADLGAKNVSLSEDAKRLAGITAGENKRLDDRQACRNVFDVQAYDAASSGYVSVYTLPGNGAEPVINRRALGLELKRTRAPPRRPEAGRIDTTGTSFYADNAPRGGLR